MKTSTVLTSLLALLSVQSTVGGHAVALSGANEVPAVSTTVTGSATIDLLDNGTIEYNVTLANPDGVALLGAAGAHIHCAGSGMNGPVVAFLAQPVDGGLLTSLVGFSGVLNDSSIIADTCGSTIAMLYASIVSGSAYINVHSTENPSGEVRGNMVKNVISVSLSGGEEVPAVTTDVTGSATIELLADGTIEYSGSVLNPSGVAVLGAAGAHIHCGMSGENGPAVVFLAQPVDGGLLTSPVQFSGILDDSSIADDSCGGTIALLYASIRAGNTYVNVHSTENPSGEVRGQTLPPTSIGDVISITLSGENAVPTITTTVTGTTTFQKFSDGTIEFDTSMANPDGVALLGVSGAHFHCAAFGMNGPLVALLAQPVEGGRMETEVGFAGYLDATSIIDGTTCGDTIDLLYASIMEGNAYVNVHSTENPSGEVRGQTTTAPAMDMDNTDNMDMDSASPDMDNMDMDNASPTSAPATDMDNMVDDMDMDSASPNFKFHSAFAGLVVALVVVTAM
jgi:hypothetical protein